MNTIETIKLDRVPKGKMPVLHASQYDNGRTHGIDLTNLGEEWKLDGTETLTINERKVDNNICSMDIENTFTGSSHIEFASFLQMCACAGSNFCELRISKGDVDIGTLNFILEVEPDPTADGIESESEIRNLKRQIEDITEEVIGDDYYTAEQTDDAIATAIEGKADTTYVNEELAKKADKTDTYTKMQVDNALNNKMNKANPTGTGSIAVGSNMLNIGSNSQTFGSNTKALGNNAFATGENTQASVANQFVFGKYNQYSFGNLVEIVGNGTSESNRSNARTLDWQGNETLAGDLTYNGNKRLSSEISRLDGRIDNLPAPMIFKGTLGVGGTIQSLPTASASNEGFTYKVITDGTYAGQTAKVGDVFTSNGSAWVLIPSGDEDNDTWRAVKVNGVEKLGNGISSGAVDFEDTANVKFEFDANGNKIKATLDGIYTADQVDTLLDDKADADNTYTKAQVDDIVYGILPDDTASGSVANFNTSLALPIKSLEVDVNAVQESGTPTPQSPKAISGVSAVSVIHCGKNLFDKNNANVILNAYIGTDIVGVGNTRTVLAKCKPNTKYTVSKNAGERFTVGYTKTIASIGVEVFGRTTNNKATSISIITGNDAQYIVAFVYNGNVDSGTPEDMLASVQIEEDNATSYESFNGATTLINLGGTYYGGYVTQDKDGHRQLVVTHSDITDLGSFTWNSSAEGYTQSPVIGGMKKTASGSTIPDMLCDTLKVDTPSNVYNKVSDGSISIAITTDNSGLRVYLTALAGLNASQVKSALTGIYIAYPLETPIVIDLPDGEPIATLVGTNNIFADTGDTSVVFKSSVNDYVSAHSGGNLLGMGGVYLGGAKSGGGEEEPDEGEDTEKTKLDEPKEEIKTIGDTKKLGGE